MKQLLLCRHAKSSWKNLELADIDRHLNSRGRKNAFVMGERLAARGMIPELILSSPAKRARKTAVRLCRGMAVSKDHLIRIDDTLYDSDASGLLGLISVIDDDYDRVMLIGHNPEFTQLVNHLVPVKIYNIPTCGIVACSFAVNSWQHVQQTKPELLFFDYPKKTEL